MARITRFRLFSIPFFVCLAALGAAVATTPAAAAGRACLPEIDDEVIVVFEPGALSEPVVIGGLWNGVDAPPPDSATGRVTAPRVLAKALLEAVATPSKGGDSDAGAVARWLAETTAVELESLHRTLEAVYEAGFVGSAEGDAALRRLGFVASLVEGTFEAIVDASIQQMEAYGALVASVSRTLDASMKRPSDDQAGELLRLAAKLVELELDVRDSDSDEDPDCED